MAKKRAIIGVCTLAVIICILEIWLNPIYTAEGALRHTLFVHGYISSALFSEIENVSDNPNEYVANTTFQLSGGEQLYLIKDHVPCHPVTKTSFDTWIIQKSGFWYHCRFSGKG